MRPYADSNFFTRLYLVLPDWQLANELMRNAVGTAESSLAVTWLHRLEIVNAFQQQIYSSRVYGQARITSEQAAIAQASFRSDLLRHGFYGWSRSIRRSSRAFLRMSAFATRRAKAFAFTM